MGIFGYEIMKGSSYSNLKTQVGNITKALKDYQMMRPDAETQRHSSDTDGVKIPVYYDGYHDYHRLDRLFNDSDILRITIKALINKMFRRGIEIVPLVENPSNEQRNIMNKLLHRINDNDQTMKDMLKMFEKNLDVTDDAYLILLKSYAFLNGKIIGSEPKEIISAHPAYMRIISDSEGRRGYNDKGERVYVDPTNRSILIDETTANSMKFISSDGVELLPAHYRGELGKDYGNSNNNNNNSRFVYYIEGEVIHQSKWNPSLLYGYSNIHACWMKVVTLIGQDRYFLLNYTKYRSPRALLTIGTTNYASAKKAWEELKDEAAKNPHTINPMLVENESGKNNVQLTELMKSPQDMQLIEFRNEDRRSIGCYDDKTEILTDEGWKYFKDLSSENVAQYNKDSKEISFVKPIEKMSYDYHGEMFSLKKKSYDLLLSPEHRVLYSNENDFYSRKDKWRVKKVKDINRAVLPQAGFLDGKEIKWLDVRKEINFRYHGDGRGTKFKSRLGYKKISGDDFIRFMGIWLSEGWATNNKHYKVEISQYEKVNPENFEEIKELMERLPFNYYIDKHRKKFTINSKEVNSYLQQYGKSEDKFVPEIIKRSSIRQKKLFIDWFGMGDGCWRDSHWEFGSKSEKMINDLQEMCITCGISATKTKSKTGHFTLNQRIKKSKEFKIYTVLRKDNIKKINYNGKIYCVSVPDKFLVVRRNGKVAISGNSLWGVMPVFAGDIQNSGGLNNETFQVDVTNVSVQEGQEIYNDNIFPWIMKNWGITDWGMKLKEPEEDDEMEEEKLLEVKIDNASKMSEMGFEISYDEKVKEFSYSEKATNPELIEEKPFIPFMNKSLDLADARRFNKILKKVMKCSDTEKKELIKKGINFDVKKELDPVLLKIISKQIFDKVYEGQSRDKSNKINNIILDGMDDKKSIMQISKDIQEIGVKKSQADLITRTENAVLKNNIRAFNFEKAEGSEDFLYSWRGPNDRKTTDLSKEIKRKSAKGLKLDDLKKLVRNTSEKFGFKPDRDWFSHFGQRHTFSRKL